MKVFANRDLSDNLSYNLSTSTPKTIKKKQICSGYMVCLILEIPGICEWVRDVLMPFLLCRHEIE